MKLTEKLKCNKGASAITLSIFVVILTSIFIVMSMNQIGNQMKSTRRRNENIELKYIAEAGTEQIIADIYKKIEENTEKEIEKFEIENDAIIQFDTLSYVKSQEIEVRANSDNNYLISHLDDAAKMYLNLSEKIKTTDPDLAELIIERIYNPIAKNGYDLDGKNLTLVGWAKEAQNGNEKALNLLIEKIGFNDNTDITPEYNGNTEIIPGNPITSGIKKDIEDIGKKIDDVNKVEFNKCEYELNLSLYTAKHMKKSHLNHKVSDINSELNEKIVKYLEIIRNYTMEDARKEIDSELSNENATLSNELRERIGILMQNGGIAIIQQQVGYIPVYTTKEEVVKKVNNLINEITLVQESLVKNNVQSGISLLEKAKRQLIEVKCRLGNVNLGGSEVIPSEQGKPTEPPNIETENPDIQEPDDSQDGLTIIVPVNINKNDYEMFNEKTTINKDVASYKLNQDINLRFKIVLELVQMKDKDNPKNIYRIITRNSDPSQNADIDIMSKYKDDSRDIYNMKSRIKFRIENLNQSNRNVNYEILNWNN